MSLAVYPKNEYDPRAKWEVTAAATHVGLVLIYTHCHNCEQMIEESCQCELLGIYFSSAFSLNAKVSFNMFSVTLTSTWSY